MEVAAADARLQQILGDDIGSGPWYEGSLGRGHSGHSASCSFPISGSRGSATLQLKAIRFDGELPQSLTHVFCLLAGSSSFEEGARNQLH